MLANQWFLDFILSHYWFFFNAVHSVILAFQGCLDFPEIWILFSDPYRSRSRILGSYSWLFCSSLLWSVMTSILRMFRFFVVWIFFFDLNISRSRILGFCSKSLFSLSLMKCTAWKKYFKDFWIIVKIGFFSQINIQVNQGY